MADTEKQSGASAEVTQERRELRAMVEDLQVQLREAQDAITASDEQLTKVSGKCERAYSEARVVSDLVGSLTGSGPSSLQSVFQDFLESQAQLLAMQTNALSEQSAPPLLSFTGEDVEAEANSFERWLDMFEERATVLSWTDELKGYHTKQHLAGTALQVFELLPPAKCSSYGQLIESLKDRFKPIDIEDLRGLEFHQFTQKTQSVEKLGLELMTLARQESFSYSWDN